MRNIGCSFKCFLKVEESIVKAPWVTNRWTKYTFMKIMLYSFNQTLASNRDRYIVYILQNSKLKAKTYLCTFSITSCYVRRSLKNVFLWFLHKESVEVHFIDFLNFIFFRTSILTQDYGYKFNKNCLSSAKQFLLYR
jgi:hypothetical protein